MTINEICWAIADFAYETFTLLELGGNAVNWAFIVFGFIVGAIWIRQMIAYDKEAAENGTTP